MVTGNQAVRPRDKQVDSYNHKSGGWLILEAQYNVKLVPPPAAVNLSVDEVSYKKYHRYLTNVVDADERAIVWNDRGRKTEVLDRYYIGIGEDNCSRIESVALDGARTFISSTNK